MSGTVVARRLYRVTVRERYRGVVRPFGNGTVVPRRLRRVTVRARYRGAVRPFGNGAVVPAGVAQSDGWTVLL